MIYLIVILFILLGIGLFLFIKYSKIKDLNNKIEVCCDNIGEILESKRELVFKVIEEVNDEELTKKSEFNESESIFENESNLFDIRWNLNKYLDNKKITNQYKKDLRKLNVIEESIDGLKDFYNISVLNYNEIFLKKPFCYFYKMLGFEQKKSFKIRKLEEYEIFKN